jgi:hypothetical protein
MAPRRRKRPASLFASAGRLCSGIVIIGIAMNPGCTYCIAASNRSLRRLAALACAALTLVALGAHRACSAAPRRADANNTRGWQLMTPEERIAHQAKIRSFEDYAACRTYQVAHHRLMEERARQQGRTLSSEQRDFCDYLEQKLPAR